MVNAPAESANPAASVLCSDDEPQSHSGLGAVAEEPAAAENSSPTAAENSSPTAAEHMVAKWCLGNIHVDIHIHPSMAKRVVIMLMDILRSLPPRPRDRAGEYSAERVNREKGNSCASLRVNYSDGHFTIMDNEYTAASASIKPVD